jgi:hypothetical protein
VWRTAIDIGFVIFLLYSNLLIREFGRSGIGWKMGLAWAIRDIFTTANLVIVATTALIDYAVFDFFGNTL